MRYLLMIYSQESPGGPPAEEIDGIKRAHTSVMVDSSQKGVLRGVEGLKPTSMATSVRMKDGQAIITDGPFAETKEQLAGFYMMECKDLDEAIEWAKRIPTSCKGASGCIEIRPVADLKMPDLARDSK
jgi:hypothetical protein